MLNFENRTGPSFEVHPPSYPDQGVPEWYRDAKLGFFVHWGLYSLPAWATVHDGNEIPTEDAYSHHQYAEWYGNTVRISGSPTQQRHERLYGVGTSYEDLADRWSVDAFDATEFVSLLADAGARYLIPTTKHHEGFCLWNTATTDFNSSSRGPKRDLISEFHGAARVAGLRFGTYFSGALDWHVSQFPPIESDTDLFRFRRNDESFARYSASQLRELIDRFTPDILWNDIEWPDGGKGAEDFGVAALLEEYFTAKPDGVVNDRWGVPYHGYLTREYTTVDQTIDRPWEATRGLGFSFGFNQAEDEARTLGGVELIRLLVDVVSKNGNLLVNVGPRADGSIPELQRSALVELGRWLRLNGEAIYSTRPWLRSHLDTPSGRVHFTAKGATVYAHVLDPSGGLLVLPEELAGVDRVEWLGGVGHTVATTFSDGSRGCAVPAELRAAPVAVAVIRG